jgi:lycopene cyclase domain-containing protein
MNYTYLIINILTISIPFLLSFDKKVHFYKRWRYLFPAIIISAVMFIAWDIVFTEKGVWGFNPRHLTGIHIFNLPLEECLFFFTVPYASVFLYDVFIAYLGKNLLKNAAKYISIILIISLLVGSIVFYDRIYTIITFSALAAYIIYLHFHHKVNYMGNFYFTYLITLIPFLMVNGVLTGSYIDEEVVWYNAAEIINWRIFTIPVEDTFYGMLLILLNVSLYEKFQRSPIFGGRKD